MYIWNYEKLAKEFAKGLVSEKTKYMYFIVPVIIAFIMSILTTVILTQLTQEQLLSLMISKCSQPLLEETLLSVVGLAIMIPFIHYLYTFNKNKCDNKDFVIRFISFGFIAMIRVLVYGLISLLLLGVIAGIMESGSKEYYEQFKIIEALLYVIILGIVFTFGYIMINSFIKINKGITDKDVKSTSKKKEFVAKIIKKEATKKLSNKGEKGKKLIAKNKKGK